MAQGSMSPVERAQARIDELEKPLETPEQVTPEPKETPVEETPAAEVAPPVEEKPSEEQKKVEDPPTEDFEKKYKSLQGMFSHLKEQINDLKDQNQQLNDRLKEASQPPAADSISSGATQAELADHVKALNEEYGEDFVKVLRPFMRAEMRDEMNEMLNERLKPVEQKVKQSEADSEQLRRDNFMSSLTQKVPDWNEIFNSTDFEIWLNENKEQFSGRKLHDLFIEANNRWDLDQMVQFFDAFKTATGRSAPAPQEKPEADPRQSLVSPGQSNASSSTPAQTGQKKIWSMAEVRQFSKDVQLGKFAGREAEMQRIDQEIFEANREGRIR